MRSRVLCVLLGLAMGWANAGASADASPLKKDHKEPDRLSPPYTTRRVVALQKGNGACPKVNGWREESLPDLVKRRTDTHGKDCEQNGKPLTASQENEQNKRSINLAKLLHKHDLDRFCIYTAPASTPSFPEPKSVGLERADPDRMALTPTAPVDLGAIGEQTWPKLAHHFLDQVGRIRLAPTTSPSVRLVFVDTQRTGEGPPNPPAATYAQPYPSWHGHAMANLGNEMLCGHGSEAKNCAIHVATRLALRYDAYEPDMSFSPDPEKEQGGPLGLVSDLGAAILEELTDWQTHYPNTKLILNLSAGWDGEYQDLDAKSPADLETSSHAVYSALLTANDLGVLVIAAAGNRTGGEKSTSPLLPAAWELRPPSWLPFPIHKLVYAVGGVDWQGLPLPNSRSGGKPSRVAYGDHAVAKTVATNGSEDSTKIYTGTSVSTVVASSSAAAAWYLRPDLRPAQVMRLISRAGEPLTARADFYAWKPLSWLISPPALKRLSLYQTVLKICGPDESLCGYKLAAHDYSPDYSPADFSALLPQSKTVVPFTQIQSPPWCANVFLGQGISISDTDACPMEELPDITAPYLVAGQPPENPCPACTAVPDPPLAQLKATAEVMVAALALTPNMLRVDSTERSSEPPCYGLAVGLDPEWVTQGRDRGTSIESAILVVDCPMAPSITERFDITSVIQPLYNSTPPSNDPVRIGFNKIGSRTSLAGCTASVDFTLKVKDSNGNTSKRSVQSPIYVDP